MAYSTKVLIAAWQMSFECSQPEWSGHSQKRDFKRRWIGTYTHAHPAHTCEGYANAGILAAGALFCFTPGQLLLDDDAHVRGMQGISNQF